VLVKQRTTTVEVNEFWLAEARKITHEDDASAIVDKALQELVRVAELKRGIKALQDTNDVFWPHYLEELRPNSWAAYELRRAAYEGREPEKVVNGRRSD